MLKQLFIATSLVSTTFGAEADYIDPDFAFLEGIHPSLSVEGDKVYSNKGTPHESTILRLNASNIKPLLRSRHPKALEDALISYTLNSRYDTERLHTAIWSDISHTCDTPLVYANFLREIFWNRYEVLSQIINAILTLPDDQIEPDLLSLSRHIKITLNEFSQKYDEFDVSPFTKANYMHFGSFLDEFSKTVPNRR
jgi:hypothetical protein